MHASERCSALLIMVSLDSNPVVVVSCMTVDLHVIWCHPRLKIDSTSEKIVVYLYRGGRL
jgi:hypothetical protein